MPPEVDLCLEGSADRGLAGSSSGPNSGYDVQVCYIP